MFISESSNVESYKNKMAKTLTVSKLQDPDPMWAHFLRDHIALIKANSVQVDISAEDMNRYKHRISDYLISVLRVSRSVSLAFKIINRIPNDNYFDERVNTVNVPDEDYLSKLRQLYVTTRNKQARKMQ